MERVKRKSAKKASRGLQKRWFRNILSIVISVVVAMVVIFTGISSTYYYNTMRSGLETKARTTTAFLSDYLGTEYSAYYQACVTLTQTYEDKNAIELQFVTARGSIIASSYGQFNMDPVQTSELNQALEDRELATFTGRDPVTGERIMAVCAPVIYNDSQVVGVMRFVSSTRLVDRQVLLSFGITLLVGVLVLVIVVVSSRYFIRSILVPVREIIDTAKRIAGGSYGAQIQKKFDDEIGELADTINEMSNQISQTEKMQSEFMSSVSHELRTPLTAIAGWSETLLSDEEMDPEETKRGVTIILRETKRLTGMVEELLEFSRMQDGRFTMNMETCNLLPEFEDTVYMYGSRLRQDGIALEYVPTEEDIPPILCDPARIRQVLLNILDNAAKHGGEGKKIIVSLCREGHQVVIRVRDFGPGIPEEELPHVKKKFYKGSSKARGSGIGLAVCEEIVSMHNGVLTLANAEGGGTLVTIRLPITEEIE